MFADSDLEKIDCNSLGRPYSEQHILSCSANFVIALPGAERAMATHCRNY